MHYNITIKGKVQGVFYRKYAFAEAQKLTLNGFVRNQPNGDVYCEAEGEVQNLKQFVEWCRKGSPFSKVMSVEVVEANMEGFVGFEIRKGM